VNSPTPLSVNFTDPGTIDTHTATINWGDGNTTNGTVSESNGSGSVSGSHTYTTPGDYTITVTVTDNNNAAGDSTAGTTAINQVSALTPAGIWIGLKNSDDVGTKFDLKAEAYKDSTLVASGELESFAGGSSGFNNAHLATIPFDSFSAVDLPAGSVLSLKVYVRNACVGSGHNSGVARLWYNDSAASSGFSATIGGVSSDYYLRDLFALATTAGPGPKKTIDVQAGAKCSAFKPFATWSTTL
jgi:PKD repeat protein